MHPGDHAFHFQPRASRTELTNQSAVSVSRDAEYPMRGRYQVQWDQVLGNYSSVK